MTEDRRARTDGGSVPLRDDDVLPYGATPDATTASLRPGRGTKGPGAAAAGPGGPGGVGTARPARFDPRPPAAARPAAKRRARLALTRVDPWSVFVLALLISLFLGIVLVIAVGVLYSLLDSLGVLDSVNTFAQDLQLLDEGKSVIGQGQVLGIAAVLAAVDVVLLTVLATLGAFLYNLCASLTGGIDVVLAERD